MESLKELDARHAAEKTAIFERFLDQLVWHCATGCVAQRKAETPSLGDGEDAASARWMPQFMRSAMAAVGRTFMPHQLTPSL